jgi:hypothetical protein
MNSLRSSSLSLSVSLPCGPRYRFGPPVSDCCLNAAPPIKVFSHKNSLAVHALLAAGLPSRQHPIPLLSAPADAAVAVASLAHAVRLPCPLTQPSGRFALLCRFCAAAPARCRRCAACDAEDDCSMPSEPRSTPLLPCWCCCRASAV